MILSGFIYFSSFLILLLISVLLYLSALILYILFYFLVFLPVFAAGRSCFGDSEAGAPGCLLYRRMKVDYISDMPCSVFGNFL